jgi:hypothetical protein
VHAGRERRTGVLRAPGRGPSGCLGWRRCAGRAGGVGGLGGWWRRCASRAEEADKKSCGCSIGVVCGGLCTAEYKINIG